MPFKDSSLVAFRQLPARFGNSWSLILLLPIFLNVGCNSAKRSEQFFEEASAAYAKKDYERAEEYANKATSADDSNALAWVLAGDAAREQGNFEQAVAYYTETPSEPEDVKTESHIRAATVLMEHLGKLTEAEKQFNDALKLDPANRRANDAYSYMLSVTGRRWESASRFLALLRRLRFDVGHLFGIATLETSLHDEAKLTRWRDLEPDDPLPRLGLAQIALDLDRDEEAEKLLRAVLSDTDALAEADAMFGQSLVKQGKFDEWAKWADGIPESSLAHPNVWVSLAMGYEQLDSRESTLRCYAEALRRNPNNQQALFRIIPYLKQFEEEGLAEQLEERAKLLVQFQEALAKVQGNMGQPAPMGEAARIAEELGRYWEARAWLYQLRESVPDDISVENKIQQLNRSLAIDVGQTIDERNPLQGVDLQQWQLTKAQQLVPNETVLEDAAESASITFADRAGQFGLDFRYFNGHREDRPGPYLFESDGGGVAAFDFDLDSYPDLFFTQGCEFPETISGTPYFDQLYRNQGGTRVSNVTSNAYLAEDRFGQGVTTGDFDNDGFDDLFVANIGGNRLYRNMGDGTFAEISDRAGIRGQEWTSSCAIADLNADGLPDIYVVNYLRGDDIHRRVCPDPNGTPRICIPLLFDGDYDKVYINRGDGTFQDQSELAGLRRIAGKGLGVVIADFDGESGLEVFVANDVVENHLYEVNAAGGLLQFDEVALTRGIAMDAIGQSQACMGVACDDFNMDGRLDLFVTNFHEEANAMYLQDEFGMFSDRSNRAELAIPSKPMLGFGTQSMDADLDGYPDLVVTNGHLVDETDLGVPFRMRPQFFRNLGDGTFVELTQPTLGDYFARQVLGRGLATLDFDQDGRQDFVVTDLEQPASLVLNTSANDAHWLSVRLVAVDSARSAIGAEVTLTSGDWTRYQQLSAGSGYQAANHSILQFGLGSREQVDLEIRWPSGKVQQFEAVPGDRKLLLIEGADQPIEDSEPIR